MARLAEAPAIGRRWLRIALIAGPAVFLAVGLLGFAVAGAFLAYPAGLAKPLIVFIEPMMLVTARRESENGSSSRSQATTRP